MAPRRFLSARWVDLAMINYEVDPGLLTRRVPRGTEIDDFGGRTFVSVVGFLFLDTRVMGIAVPLHRDFEEVNLRFYVRRETGGQLRRGVAFVKEIVPRRTIAWVARLLYNENYIALPMSHGETRGPDSSRVTYEWRYRGRSQRLGATPVGEAVVPPAGSEESFIAEHYWGYVRRRDGSTAEYQVEHPPWRVWRASNPCLECDAVGLYGPEFADVLAGPPSSCFVAEGSPVVVRRATRLRD